MKIEFYLFSGIILSFNYLSCNDSVFDADNYTAVDYISHQNSGCLSASGVLSKENELTIEVERKGNYFYIFLNFTTLCDASFKDSVSILSNEISICLANLNDPVLCVCPYTDEFKFRLIKGSTFKINFYLRNSFEADYHLAADTTVSI